MSTRTDLTITSTNHSDATKKVTNKINYVNPNITNQQAVTLANMFTDLTKDTYNNTTRTDTTDCDTIITRPMTDFVFLYGTNSSPMPADGVCSFTTNANIKFCGIRFKTTMDSAPQILNFVDSAEDYKTNYTDITYGGPNGWSSQKEAWNINIATSIDSSQRQQITPRTITFTLHFDATTQYDAYDKDITINVMAEE